MNYWLVKSEPFKYSWDQFVKDGVAVWDGVRNYAARNNLRDMKVGDHVLFYHSNEGLEIVGIAQVSKESYQDPTTEDKNWVVVELKPLKPLTQFIKLSEIKADPLLQNMQLAKLGRLSVSAVTADEYKKIVKLGKV